MCSTSKSNSKVQVCWLQLLLVTDHPGNTASLSFFVKRKLSFFYSIYSKFDILIYICNVWFYNVGYKIMFSSFIYTFIFPGKCPAHWLLISIHIISFTKAKLFPTP